MWETIEYRGWRFCVDPVSTQAAYAQSRPCGAHLCGCCYCRNLVAQRDSELPQDLRSLLVATGIDPHMEAEVWEVPSDHKGYNLNSGWWHFIGHVEKSGANPVQIDAVPGGRARSWQVQFREGTDADRISGLPASPLVAVEFFVELPWVLDEPYPE